MFWRHRAGGALARGGTGKNVRGKITNRSVIAPSMMPPSLLASPLCLLCGVKGAWPLLTPPSSSFGFGSSLSPPLPSPSPGSFF